MTSMVETKKKSPVPELPFFNLLSKSAEDSDSEDDTLIPIEPSQPKKNEPAPSGLSSLGSSLMSFFSGGSARTPLLQKETQTEVPTISTSAPPTPGTMTTTTTTTTGASKTPAATTTTVMTKAGTSGMTPWAGLGTPRATLTSSTSSSNPTTPTTPLTPRAPLSESPSGSSSSFGPFGVALRHLRKFQHFTVTLDEVLEGKVERRDEGEEGKWKVKRRGEGERRRQEETRERRDSFYLFSN